MSDSFAPQHMHRQKKSRLCKTSEIMFNGLKSCQCGTAAVARAAAAAANERVRFNTSVNRLMAVSEMVGVSYHTLIAHSPPWLMICTNNTAKGCIRATA